MKRILLLLSCCLLHNTAFSQFTLSGSITNTRGNKYLYLSKITGLKNEAVFIDRIEILPVQKFSYVLKAVKSGELYKLTYSPQGDVEEFPERSFVFPAERKGELRFSTESIEELYSAKVIRGSRSARLISSEILAPLSIYFSTVAAMGSELAENGKRILFTKIIEFQQEYIRSLQYMIVYSKEPAVIVAALFFLAKIQEASGEGNFRSYYNTARCFLPATDLTNNFKQLFESTTGSISREDILSLLLKSSSEKTAILFSDLLITRYTLMNFWASWCGSCRKAIKNEMRVLINKYKRDTSFSFIAVSVDRDSSQWQNAQSEDGSNWKNYLVNYTGKELLPDFLKGNGLPYYILLDKEGHILFSSNCLNAIKKRMQFYH
jgi:thiol-disulfide isomerase/thioredoxin